MNNPTKNTQADYAPRDANGAAPGPEAQDAVSPIPNAGIGANRNTPSRRNMTRTPPLPYANGRKTRG